MAFDQITRNRLQKFVSDARKLLSEEFTRQLQNTYGLDPITGEIADLSDLPNLSPGERQTSILLRTTLEHYLAASHKADPHADKMIVTAALDRIVREQAFTVLNRLAALRMAEARHFIMESISHSYQSQGFQLYQRIAGSALGETGQAYQVYLFSIFDELSLDLAVLFDRYSSQGRLFPRETILLELLVLINHAELELLWAEDETVGWIYQYFNSKEERKKMRDESQAPRNSRELAVRNQFFTPRYVVEFLTDNTLGSIWYEMTKGKTTLVDSCQYLVRRPNQVFLDSGQQIPGDKKKDGETKTETELSQEELLQQTVYIQYRPLKDPRDIKMLDPACGSMHFGLYAFDLFEKIYGEAWDLEETDVLENFIREKVNGEIRKTLHQTYHSKESFLADVPNMIIENNIHGVDIDPRAAQIAGLSLWLRAQKSWADNSIHPNKRPQIQRSNIVCAEPMPGERGLLKEFTSQIQPRVLGQLVEEIFDKMQLAGEAGTLLKIEEEIQSAIEEARSQKDENTLEVQGGLFGNNKWEVREGKRYYSFGDVGDNFWDKAEYLILSELERYAESTTSGGSNQKRLFVADAARGFAFIDLCRKRFDVVLMNPPFGSPSSLALKYLKSAYSDAYTEIYLSFFSRAIQLCTMGKVGAITSRTWLNLSKQFLRYREHLIKDRKLESVVELGAGVLDDATVETATTVISTSDLGSQGIATFIDPREKEASDLGVALHQQVVSIRSENREVGIAFHSFEYFKSMPAYAFIHGASGSNLTSLGRGAKSIAEIFVAKQGMGTSDDYRFVRMSWELPRQQEDLKTQWVPIFLGDQESKFFAEHFGRINWVANGLEVKTAISNKYGSASRTMLNMGDYFRSGLSYQYTGQTFRVHPMPEGSIFSMSGQALFPKNDSDKFAILALLNAEITTSILKKINPGRFFQSGHVNALPFPSNWLKYRDKLDTIGRTALEVCMLLASYDERSKFFNPEVYRQPLDTIIRSQNDLLEKIEHQVSEANEIACFCFNEQPTKNSNRAYLKADEREVAHRLISLEFYNAFIPSNLIPPPSKTQAELAFSKVNPTSNPLCLKEVILSGEQIVGLINENLENIGIAAVEENIMLDNLGVLSVDEYVNRPNKFFAYHLKDYTKNRRMSPIYWPLQSESGSYTLWVYYQGIDEQTLYSCINNFIEPRLMQVEQDLNLVRSKSTRSSQQEKELVMLTDFSIELRNLRDEILRIAKFWKPNLNDGVQITAAPLWKLFQHKPWQKKLKETWERLEKGDYDWAHLACSIWPERVLHKCHQDRSIAIVNGVESDLWEEVEVPVGKSKKTKFVWQPKEMSEAQLELYIQQYKDKSPV